MHRPKHIVITIAASLALLIGNLPIPGLKAEPKGKTKPKTTVTTIRVESEGFERDPGIREPKESQRLQQILDGVTTANAATKLDSTEVLKDITYLIPERIFGHFTVAQWEDVLTKRRMEIERFRPRLANLAGVYLTTDTAVRMVRAFGFNGSDDDLAVVLEKEAEKAGAASLNAQGKTVVDFTWLIGSVFVAFDEAASSIE